MMKKLTTVALLAAGVLLAQATAHKSPELAFNLPGQGDRLLSQYRGKVVALEFILTTCPHCQASSRVMTKLQQTYATRGLQVLDVAVDPDAGSKVEAFSKDHQVGFPVGWTSIESMMTYMGFSSRPVVPQLVLIDRDGNIHYQTPREGDAESMKEEVIASRVEELLKSKAMAKLQRHK